MSTVPYHHLNTKEGFTEIPQSLFLNQDGLSE